MARGSISAWQSGRRGERYILGGENLFYREICERIAGLAGVEPPRRALPGPLARGLGVVGDGLEWLGYESLLNSVTVRYGFDNRFHFSSAKAEAELTYNHGPIGGAIGDAIAWFRTRGLI